MDPTDHGEHGQTPQRAAPWPHSQTQTEGETLPTTDRPPPPDPELCLWAESADRPGCARWAEPIWTDSRVPHLSDGWWTARQICTACEARDETEAAERRLRVLRDASGLPPLYWGFGFSRYLKQRRDEPWDDFRVRLDDAPDTLGLTIWNAQAARSLRAWRLDAGRSVLLAGPVGGGKTTLLACLLNRILADQAADMSDTGAAAVYFIQEREFYERLAEERSARAGRRYLGQLSRVPILVIDDLGTTEDLKPWQQDAVEYLFGVRYGHKRPTLITSNLRLASDDKTERTITSIYGHRVGSRLHHMLGARAGTIPGYMELVGVDWRTDNEHPAAVADDTPTPAQPSLDLKSRPTGEETL